MKHVDTEQRCKRILYAIVESYVDSAMPVGSRALSQRFRWSMSPATIRNVMADLEEIGLITHPHTSAGRVPTDKGYRVYVESLLEPRHLTKEEESLISKVVSRRYEDFEDLMQNVSRAIGMITREVGIVLTPRLKRTVFKQIEFIPIDASSSRVLAVLVTRSGIVKNSLLELEEDLTKTELFRMSEFLNQELEGLFLGDIKNHLTRRILQERDSFYAFLKKAISIFSRPGFLRAEDKMYFDGTAGLMSHPEFDDMRRARSFLKLFEEKQDILDVFNGDIEAEGVKVHIGKENTCKYIQDFAVVTCNYKVKDRAIGALGAIGPTRMEYGKVISAVTYLSELLGRALEDLG